MFFSTCIIVVLLCAPVLATNYENWQPKHDGSLETLDLHLNSSVAKSTCLHKKDHEMVNEKCQVANIQYKQLHFEMSRGRFFVTKLEIPDWQKLYHNFPYWMKFDSVLRLLIVLPFQPAHQKYHDTSLLLTTTNKSCIYYCIRLEMIEDQYNENYNSLVMLNIKEPVTETAFNNMLYFLEIFELYFSEFKVVDKDSVSSSLFKHGFTVYSNGNFSSVFTSIFLKVDLNCRSRLIEFIAGIKHQKFINIQSFWIKSTSMAVKTCLFPMNIQRRDDVFLTSKTSKRRNNDIATTDKRDYVPNGIGNQNIENYRNFQEIKTNAASHDINRQKRDVGFFAMMNSNNIFGKKSSSIQQCTANTPPVTKQNIITSTINANKFQHILLSSDLFTDQEDGGLNNLNIHLTWANGNNIAQSDWLQFSPALNLIYTWATYKTIIQQPAQGYEFILKATDSCNHTSSLKMVLKIVNTVLYPPCHEFILIVESKMDLKTPYIHVLVDLMNLVWKHFQYDSLDDILVIDFTNVLSQKNTFSLEFSDQTLECSPCDRTVVTTQLNLMKTSPNYESFKPNFKYLGLTVDLTKCNGNSPPIILCPIPRLNISQYGVTSHILPLNTFFDAEDGFMEELDVKLISNSQNVLIFLESSTLYVYQIVSSAISSDQFSLEARDTSNAMVSLHFQVQTNQYRTQPYGYFEFDFTSYYNIPVTNAQILHHFLLKISQLIGAELNNFSILLFQRSGSYPQHIKIRWTLQIFYSNNLKSKQHFTTVKNQLFFGNTVSIGLQTILSPFITRVSATYKMSFVTLLPTPTITQHFQTSIITQPLTRTVKRTSIHPSTLTIKPSSTVPNINGPYANYQIGPFSASFCDFFVYPIPNDLFSDSVDGNTRMLNLTLRSYTHEEIGTDSWLQIDSDIQTLYGFLKVTDYINAGGRSVQYHLVATNSRNVETSLLFRINLPEKVPQVLYQITMIVSSFYDPTAPDINEQLLLLLKISSYFGETKLSWINILSFTRNDDENHVTLAWTNCTLPNSNTCQKDIVNTLSSKVVLSNGLVNSNFANSLSPQYTVKDIEAVIEVNCPTTTVLPSTSSIVAPTKPSIIKSIPTLNVFTNAYFKFKIPSNTFYDVSDGNTRFLSLSFVHFDGTPLKANSWIQFNKAAQEIYAQLYIDTLEGQISKTFQFLLIATNSFKRSTGLTVNIHASRREIPLGGALVYISGTAHFNTHTSHLQILTVFLQKYNLFLGGRNKMEVQNFLNYFSGGFMVTFTYSRTETNNECDSPAITSLKQQHLYWDGNPNPFFIQTFLPEFVILNVTFNSFGVCDIQPPKTTPSPGPNIVYQIPTLYANTNSVFMYQIPKDTFFDATDGNTRNLQLSLLNENSDELSSSYWLQLIDNQNLLGVVTLQDIEYSSGTTYRFILRATNKRNKYVDMMITINTINNINIRAFRITVKGSNLHTTYPQVDVQLAVALSQRIHLYLYVTENVHETGMIRFKKTNNQFEFVLADNRLTTETCYSSHHNMVMSKLFTSNGQINSQFTLAMYPQFTISSVGIESNCIPVTTPSPGPTIKYQIPTLFANINKVFNYVIPENTFLDVADGNARNLKLSLLSQDYGEISSENWLQLLQNQRLLGVLTHQNFESSTSRMFKFILRATNSKNQFVNMILNINAVNTISLSAFRITVKGVSYTSQSLTNPEVSLMLSIKMHNYLYGMNFQLETGIIKFEKTGNQFEFVLADNRLTTATCYSSHYNMAMSQLFTSNGQINSQFTLAMYPQFTISSVGIESNCIPVTTPSPGPTINYQIPTLFANINKVFNYVIPENTFLDVVDGNVRNLKLSLLSQDYGKISSENWLQLLQNQKLLGVLTHQNFESSTSRMFKFILRATNSNNQFVNMILNINAVNTISLNAFRITVKGVSYTSQSLTNPEVSLMLSNKIHNYLYGMDFQLETGIIKFEKTGNQFEFVLADNRLTTETCYSSHYNMVMSKLFTSNGQINSQFTLAMYPQFTISSVGIESNCVPVTTPSPGPTIKYQIPTLFANINKVFNYVIPENTFFDVVDGNSRNLKLSLLSQDYGEISSENWLQLLQNQRLLGVLTHQNFESSTSRMFKFILRATNSKNQFVNMILNINAVNTISLNAFRITVKGVSYTSQSLTNPEVSLMLSNKMHNYLYGMDFQLETGIIKFEKTGNQFEFVLADNRLTTETCYSSHYNMVMSKLFTSNGQINSQFTLAMYPQFTISSVGIESNCVPVTTPSPGPTIKYQIPTIFANINKVFNYVIPENTFHDVVDGNARNLKLTLLSQDRDVISPQNWLQLLENQKLLGVLTLQDFDLLTSKTFTFLLRATNTRGSFVDLVLNIHAFNNLVTNAFKITLKGLSFISQSKTDVEILSQLSMEFQEYLYESNDQQETGIVLFQLFENNFHFSLVDNRLTSERCYDAFYVQIRSKLFSANEQINPQLMLSLYPLFAVTQVTFDEQCTPLTSSTTPSKFTTLKPTPVLGPLIINKIPQLILNIYTTFIYQIPTNTFYDYKDGYTRNLHLKVLNIDRSSLTKKSWLQFDDTSQTITARVNDEIVIDDTVTFLLVATNSMGMSNEQKIVIKLPYPLPSVTHEYELSFVVSQERNTDLEVIILVIQKIKFYIQENIGIRVIRFQKQQTGLLIFQWSFNTGEICNRNEIENLKNKFFWSSGHIRASFIQSLIPDINVGKLTFLYAGDCIKTPTPTPTSSVTTTKPPKHNLPPTVLKQIPQQSVSTCEKFVYKLHEDAFFDVEDGLTRNLRISVLEENGSDLLPSTWLFFNETTQEFRGIITVDEANYKSLFIYKIVATDKGGLSIHQYLKIHVDIESNTGYTIINKGTMYNAMKRSELLCFINDKLQSYISMQSSGIEFQSFSVTGDEVKSVEMEWKICNIPCGLLEKSKINDLLFSNGLLKNSFILLFIPSMVITNARLEDNCISTTITTTTTTVITTPSPNKSPPIIFNEIPILTVTRCSTFHYVIPEKTCYDKSDGWTRKLQVNIRFINGTDIGHHYWLHLNPSTQTVYGVLKETDIQNAIDNTFKFQFTCTDSDGETALQMIQINFQSDLQQPKYSITIQSYVYSSAYTSNAEIQLLWLKKLAKFLQTSKDNFQVISFQKATVLYPQIVISLYDCSITDPCSQAFTDINNKLFNMNGLNTDFSQVMIPEFVLISGRSEVQKPCITPSTTSDHIRMSSAIIDTNKPPIAVFQQLTINIHPCRNIQYHIPTNAFYDHEDGYTPNLHLSMSLLDGSPLPTDSFIKLNVTTQMIIGVVVYTKIEKENKYSLIAMDSKGRIAKSQIILKLTFSYQKPSHKLSAKIFTHTLKDYIGTMQLFLQSLSQYYGDKQQNAMLQSVTVIEKNYMNFTWSNCSLISSCNTNEIQNMKSKIILYDTIMNANFIANMAPHLLVNEARFTLGSYCIISTSTVFPTSRHITSSITSLKPTPTPTVNTPPKVLKNIPFIEIEICSPFSYRVPEDIFVDNEQGNTRHLKLSLLTFNEEPLPKSSWIRFVESTQVVYGQPRVEDMKTTKTYVNYILKATDDYGASTITVLTIILPEKPTVNFFINATVNPFFDYSTPDLTAQLFLINKISSYMKDPDVTNILVLSFIRTPDVVKVSWTNCTQQVICSYAVTQSITQKFISLDGTVNDDFKIALSPYYTNVAVTTHISSSCKKTSSIMPSLSTSQRTLTISPVVSSKLPVSTAYATSSTVIPTNRPPIVNVTIPPIQTSICKSFAYKIPNNLFIDEDGLIKDLQLTMLYVNGSILHHTSWVQYNPRLHIIYGLIKRKDIDIQPVDGYKFLLQATDSMSVSTATIVPFEYIEDNNPVGVSIIMRIRCTYISTYPYVNDVFQIINIISSYFRDSTPNTIKSIDLTASTTDPNILFFTWTNCTLDFTSNCPEEDLSLIYNQIMTPNDKVKASFIAAFSPQYVLEDVIIKRHPPCDGDISTTPDPLGGPVISKYINPITIKRCSYLQYKIPNDTFYDQKDGSTQFLTLSLKFLNDSNIPDVGYWLQFDSKSQTIFGNPVELKNLKVNGYLFKLVAYDSDGNFNSMNIRINVQSQNEPVLQNITLNLMMNFEIGISNQQIQHLLVEKIAHFYNDSSTGLIQVVEFQRDEMLVSIKWSNCTTRGFVCNKELVKSIQDSIMDTNGKCRNQFSFVFLPEFTVRDLLINNHYSCNLTELSSVITPTSSIKYPHSSVPVIPSSVFALKNITLEMSFCGSLNYAIDRNAFYDSYNQNKGPLTYTLHYTDQLQVDCASWVQLRNENIHAMSIHSTNNAPRKYLLKAKNTLGSFALANVNIDLLPIQPNITYKVAFSFLTSFNSSVCDADVLHRLLDKIISYFGDKSDENITTVYFSRGDRSTRSYIMYGNCSLRTDVCDFQKINKISEMLYNGNTSAPNPYLIEQLQPEFYNISVLDEKLGPCSKNQLLAVGKEPEAICASSCGQFTYTVPDGTFVDPEGGTTGDLIIEVTTLSDAPLTGNDWIHFHQPTHTFIGMVTASVKQNEPSKGYRYKMTAYDKQGAAAEAVLVIKVCDSLPTYESSVTLQYECAKNITSVIEEVIAILRSISEEYLDGTLDSVFLIDFVGEGNKISFTWANCSSADLVVNIDDLVGGSFSSNCVSLNHTKHDNKDYPPTTNISSIRLKPSFCKDNIYVLPATAFQDKENTKDLQITLTYSNLTDVSTFDWIGFVQSNMKLYMVLTNMTKTDIVYQYFFIAKDSKNQTASIPLYIEVFEMFPTVNYLITSEYKSYYTTPTAAKIHMFLQKWTSFFKSNDTLLIAQYQVYDNKTIMLQYGNCSLPTTNCAYEEVEKNKQQLKPVDDTINPDLFTFLFPDCILESVTSEKLGTCLKAPNQRPNTTIKMLEINVDSCGYTKYKISDSLFYDPEDGPTSNLTLSLSINDSCWIEFHKDTQTLYIMATQEALAAQPNDGYMFILTATDSGGLTATKNIKIIFKELITSSFEFVFLLEVTSKLKTSCLQEKISILDKLNSYFGISSGFAIKSALKGADNIFIEVIVVNCTLRYEPCDFIAIDKTLTQIEDQRGSIKMEFKNYLLPEFVARYLSKRRGVPCLDDSNTSPKQNLTLQFPNITSCYHGNYQLPSGLVYDNEDGDLDNLNVQLFNASNGFEISNTSWIYLNKDSKTITIISSVETARYQPHNGYTFILKVTDSRKASIEITFNLYIDDINVLKTFSVKQPFTIKSNQIFSVSLNEWKNETENTLETSIQLISYKLFSENQLELNWTLCEPTVSKCNFDVLKEIEKLSENDQQLELMKNKACIHDNRSPPNATGNITITINPCEKFSYQLPETLFYDQSDGNTRNLSISMKQIYPSQFTKTFVYDMTTQTLTGIPLVDYFEMFEHIEFEVIAKDSDDMATKTYLMIFLHQAHSQQYNINAELIYYVTEGTDFTFLNTFCSDTVEYLNIGNSGLIIKNMTQVSSGISRQYTINFSPCTILTDECDRREIERIEKLMLTNKQPNFNYVAALLDDIVVKNVDLTKVRDCNKSPPRVEFQIGELKTRICEELNYELPEESFVDFEDGSTANLTISIKNIDSYADWIDFDVINQQLNAKPTINELLSMPNDGYTIVIEAIDSDDNTITQNVSLIIDDNIDNFNFFVTLELRMVTYAYKDNYSLKKYLETRIKTLLMNQIPGVTLVNISNIIDNKNFVATFYDCNLNPAICNLFENVKFYRSFVDLNNNFEPKIEQGLLPEFQLIRVNKIEKSKCVDIDKEPPYSTATIDVLNLTLCKQLQYRIPEKLFMDRKDGIIKKSSITFCTLSNHPISKDSPVRYDQNAQVIYAYITQNQLKQYQSKQLVYLLKAVDADNNTADVTVYVNLPILQENIYIVNVSATSVIDYTLPDLDVTIDFLSRLFSYFGDTNSDSLSVIEFKRETPTSQRIFIQWNNCTIRNRCQETEMNYIEEMMFSEQNKFRYIETLGRNSGFLDVVTTTDKRGDVCAKSNITIELKYCGNFTYQVPNDAFVNTSKVTLQYESGLEVPESYWIQYNQKDNILYGFPDEEALKKSKITLILAPSDVGESTDPPTSIGAEIVYVLIIGNVSNPLNITSNTAATTNDINIYSNCNRDDQTVGRHPWLDDSLDILSRFLNNLNISMEEIHLKNTQRLQNNGTNTISINMCSNVNISLIANVIINVISDSTKNCKIIDIEVITPPKNPETPRVVNSIPTIEITCGIPYSYQIPENTFQDFQDGTTSNLLLQLLDQNQNIVNKQYVQLDNNNQMIFFVSVENCYKIVTDEVLIVKATDKDGNYVLDTFNLKEIQETVSCCMYISNTVNKEYTQTVNNNQYIYNYYQELQTHYNDTEEDKLRLVSITKRNNKLTNIVYTSKQITNKTCINNTTDDLTAPVFTNDKYNITSADFKSRFTPYNFTNASVVTNKACNDTTGTEIIPPVVLPPSAGKLVSSEDWLYYLIPLFVLAFMLLAACICFYCCRCCYKLCCGSGKAGKKQYFIEDFASEPNNSIDGGVAAKPRDSIDGGVAAKPRDSIDGGVAARPRDEPVPSAFSAIPIEVTSGSEEDDDPGQSWDVAPQSNDMAPLLAPSSRSQSIIAPVAIQQQEDSRRFSEMFSTTTETKSIMKSDASAVHLQDIYAQPLPKVKRTKRLDISGPVTTSYIEPSNNTQSSSFTLKRDYQRQFEDESRRQQSHVQEVHKQRRVGNRSRLRLPTIPKGPPPPYSPPRRTRIIRQNVIPDYYGPYVRQHRQHEVEHPVTIRRRADVEATSLQRRLDDERLLAHDISLDRISRGSNKRTIVVQRPQKRKKLISLPLLKKYKKNKTKRKKTPVKVVHLPVDSSSTSDLSVATNTLTRYDSDSSVEVQAVLRGKGSALKKILRKSPISYLNHKRRKKPEEKYQVSVIKSPTLIKKRKIRRRLPSIDDADIEIIRRKRPKTTTYRPSYDYKYTKPYLYDYVPMNKTDKDYLETKETVAPKKKLIAQKEKTRPTLDELLESIDLNNREVRAKRRKVPLTKRYQREMDSSSDLDDRI